MSEALDDFSLLVDLKNSSDLRRRPNYVSCINASTTKLAAVLAPYYFDEPYLCGLSGCRTRHQKGFLVLTSDNVETNIGKDCGKRIFGEEFAIKANLQKQRADLKYQLDTLQRVCDEKDKYLARISELYDRCTGTKWAESALKQLKESLSHPVATKLHARATRGEITVNIEREATKEERDRHSVSSPNAKPLLYVTEKVGDLQGLNFLNTNPDQAATELKNKFHELSSIDAKSLTPKQRREWVNWASDIEQSFNAIEEVLADAVRFFAQENILLIHKLEIIEQQCHH